MKLQSASRKLVDIPARFFDRKKRELAVTSLEIATVPIGTKTSAATLWTTVPISEKRATIYLYGPESGGPAAGVTVPTVSVPPTGLDLWIRPTDTLESDPIYVERITLV